MRGIIGQTIGDYEIIAKLGAGAMGAVFKARQISLNRFVALKVLPSQLAEDAAFIGRFKHEAQAAAALNHPNIVHVYAAGTHNLDGETLHYFAMEYVEGQTLHGRLRDEGRLEPDEALAIIVYLAEALDHAWQEARIIHRDIKPSNIFLSNKGAVKLGDLGLAKSVGDAGQSLTQGGTVVVTAYYMSPEQARGDKDLDFRSDIYSLGCTLYQMLSGRYPYEGNGPTVMAKHLTEPPPAILKVLPSCPVPVALVLGKMLVKNRAERQSSYAQLLKELRRAYEKITSGAAAFAVDTTGVTEADASPAMPAPTSVAENAVNKPRRTSPAILHTLMGTTAVIILAGALVWAPWKQSEQQPLNSEAAKARSAPVTQTILSAAAERPKEGPKPASEAPQQSGAGVSPAQSFINGQAGRLSHSKDRGTEAPPTFQTPADVPTTAAPALAPPAQPVAHLAQAAAPLTPPAPSTPATAGKDAGATLSPAPADNAPRAVDDAFIKSVSAMQPEQQVQAVVAKLKELNPNFDGRETHKIEGGAVTMLGFSTVGVTDISPVKALRWLRTLNIVPPALNQKGSLENLTPLQGMQLTWLWCHNNPITDLSPLKGLPLTTLSFGGTQVSDLSPLAGMKLQVLSFNDTVVSDLAPLEGMPLTVLWCNNTKVSDIAPVKAMPLREIKCDFVAERDAAVLRGIRTLAKINDMPAATFWARVGPVATTAPSTANAGVSAARSTKATLSQSRGTEGAPTLARGPEKTMTTSTGIELVWIPPGEFMLGSTPEERAWALANGAKEEKVRWEGEQPRKAAIKQGFWLGRTEVTVGQWREFINATGYQTDAEKKGFVDYAPIRGKPSGRVDGASWKDPNFGFKLKDNHPVNCMSWNDAVAFCEWLNEREHKTGRLSPGYKIRLPTEAEWEYACRAGKQTKFWWGDTVEGGDNRLNWKGTADGFEFVSPVDHYGARGRNKFGLADISGNVREWCLDEFDPVGAHEEPYKGNPSERVMRLGGYELLPAWVRCAYREPFAPNKSGSFLGFRVTLGPAR